MTFERLPASTSTIYSELVEQALALERERATAPDPPGSLVEKRIGGRSYLYWQVRTGERTSQTYLGPDTEELRRELSALESRRRDRSDDDRDLARLAAMTIRGGARREPEASAAVLRLLADLGLFRRGAVLIGSQALRVYENLLGVRIEAALVRTQDVDLAHSLVIAVASREEEAPQVESGLARLGFLAIPGLDPRHASTSFRLRGRDLRVDFLVPQRDRSNADPVAVPSLSLSAQPLPFLDYLIAEISPAVVLAARPILVRVPDPARFALHKLWVASQRSVHEATKATKDRRQSTELLEVLAEDRPADLDAAWKALARHPAPRRTILGELGRLEGRGAEAARRLLQHPDPRPRSG